MHKNLLRELISYIKPDMWWWGFRNVTRQVKFWPFHMSIMIGKEYDSEAGLTRNQTDMHFNTYSWTRCPNDTSHYSFAHVVAARVANSSKYELSQGHLSVNTEGSSLIVRLAKLTSQRPFSSAAASSNTGDALVLFPHANSVTRIK